MAVYQSLAVTLESQDPAQNRSLVRLVWQSTQTGLSYNDTVRTATLTISYNGGQPVEHSLQYTLPANSTAVISQQVLEVEHDQNGDGWVQVQTWMDTRISAGVVTLSKTLQLPRIPTATGLSATDGYIGGVSRIALNKKNAAYTHTLRYTFGKLSGYVTAAGEAADQPEYFGQDSVDFLLPESFYSQIPNSTEGVCTLVCATYNGEDQVGQSQSAAFTVSALESLCAPEISCSVLDENPLTTALTGDPGKLVRYGSHALCTANVTTRGQATLEQLTIDGQHAPEGYLVIPGIGQSQVEVTATDSRGYRKSLTVQLEPVPYIPLTANVTAQRTDPTGGGALLSVRGSYYKGNFGAEDNSLTVEYQVNGGDRIPMAVSYTENGYVASVEVSGLAYDQGHYLKIYAWDKLTQLTKTAFVGRGIPVFDWGERDFAFHVPVQMDQPLGVEQGGTGAASAGDALANLGLSLPLPVEQGGTGAVTGEAALANLGISLPLPVTLGGTGVTSGQALANALGLGQTMLADTEYPTAHFWQGKPVYTRLVTYGIMPNKCTAGVSHGARAQQILLCCGTMSCGKTIPYGGTHTYRVDVFADKTNVYIDAESDYSSETAQIQIWYTKEETDEDHSNTGQ